MARSLRSWQWRRACAGIALFCGVLAGVILFDMPEARAQPEFGVELEAGRGFGFTPYLRNVVHPEFEARAGEESNRQPFRPRLADEHSGWGTSFALRLVARNIHGGLMFRWFELGEATVHHTGESTLPPTRIRPDGTVDDSGVEYRSVESPTTRTLDATERTNLLVFGLTGGYRFYLYDGAFELFAPVNGTLLMTYVTRPAGPFEPGLEVSSGLGAVFDFVSVMSLMVTTRVHALASRHYGRRSDSARRAIAIGESTESALFSTQLYVTFNLGLQFEIR